MDSTPRSVDTHRTRSRGSATVLLVGVPRVGVTADGASQQAGHGLVSAAAVSCWTWTWGREGRNFVGVLLWTFRQRIDWCGDGTRITDIPWRQVTATVNSAWWSYNGLVGDFTAGGQGFGSYRSFVQGSFSYRPPYPWMNRDNFPWLDMTAHADGRGTGSGGG